jgi:predicted CoA-substrate-specific enzyme activase
MNELYGLDLGSRFVKLAIEAEGQRQFLGPYDTAQFYRRCVQASADGPVLRRDILGLEDDGPMACTGYGKARLGNGVQMIPELEAIAAGAMGLTGIGEAVVLDIGGQDSKALLLKAGRMADFEANDRCAASSGRFLENMARAMGLELEEIGNYWEDPVELSSTCAIFGETELVGLIAEGHDMARLAAGVNLAILRRVLPLLARFRFETLILTGGVAYNKGLRELLRQRTGADIIVPERPDFVAAVGCCNSIKA